MDATTLDPPWPFHPASSYYSTGCWPIAASALLSLTRVHLLVNIIKLPVSPSFQSTRELSPQHFGPALLTLPSSPSPSTSCPLDGETDSIAIRGWVCVLNCTTYVRTTFLLNPPNQPLFSSLPLRLCGCSNGCRPYRQRCSHGFISMIHRLPIPCPLAGALAPLLARPPSLARAPPVVLPTALPCTCGQRPVLCCQQITTTKLPQQSRLLPGLG